MDACEQVCVAAPSVEQPRRGVAPASLCKIRAKPEALTEEHAARPAIKESLVGTTHSEGIGPTLCRVLLVDPRAPAQ